MYTGSLGTVSTREDWLETVGVVDDDGADVTITSATIVVAVRASGTASGDTPDLTASTDDGSVVIGSPSFTFTFTVSQMRGLDPGLYDVGCTILLDGITRQLLIGTVSILDGIVA